MKRTFLLMTGLTLMALILLLIAAPAQAASELRVWFTGAAAAGSTCEASRVELTAQVYPTRDDGSEQDLVELFLVDGSGKLLDGLTLSAALRADSFARWTVGMSLNGIVGGPLRAELYDVSIQSPGETLQARYDYARAHQTGSIQRVLPPESISALRRVCAGVSPRPAGPYGVGGNPLQPDYQLVVQSGEPDDLALIDLSANARGKRPAGTFQVGYWGVKAIVPSYWAGLARADLRRYEVLCLGEEGWDATWVRVLRQESFLIEVYINQGGTCGIFPQ